MMDLINPAFARTLIGSWTDDKPLIESAVTLLTSEDKALRHPRMALRALLHANADASYIPMDLKPNFVAETLSFIKKVHAYLLPTHGEQNQLNSRTAWSEIKNRFPQQSDALGKLITEYSKVPDQSPTPTIANVNESQDFTTVSSKRRKSQSDNSTPGNQPPVPVQNRFQAISESEDSDGDMDTANHAPEQTTVPVKPRPLYVQLDTNWADFVKEADRVTKLDFSAKMSGETVQILCKTIPDFRKFQEYLISNSIPFHFRNLKSETPLKFKILGLPATTPIQTIEEALRAKGFKPIQVKQLRSQRTQKNTNIFLTFMAPSLDKDQFLALNELMRMMVTILPFQNKGARQCYNCQLWNHHSANCSLPPRCLKCAGAHKTYQCTKKDRSTPAQCCNCGGPHPANYSKCTANPSNRSPNATAKSINGKNSRNRGGNAAPVSKPPLPTRPTPKDFPQLNESQSTDNPTPSTSYAQVTARKPTPTGGSSPRNPQPKKTFPAPTFTHQFEASPETAFMSYMQNFLSLASAVGISDVGALFSDIGATLASTENSTNHTMAAFKVFCRHVYLSSLSPNHE